MRAPELLFWLGAGAAAYGYAGYPLLLALAGVVRRRGTAARDDWRPAVSIIVAAHDEERHIAVRLDNLLALDWPADRREIIVVDDGSTDATAACAGVYAARGVRLLRQAPQQGKTAAQNAAAAAATGEVLVFADANGFFSTDAVRRLVRHLADPSVGAVCGALHYRQERAGGAGFGERCYWRYERWLKRMESASGSLVGVNNAIYALPRRLYEPLPAAAQSDLVVALRLRAAGKRIVYAADAVCTEAVRTRAAANFTAKRRIVARAIASVLAETGRLWQIGQPWFALKLASHKLLRWLLPWILAALLLPAGVLAATDPGYRLLLAIAFGFVTLALAGWLLDRRGVRLRLLALPYYFCLVNGAALLALVDVIAGRQPVVWPPARDG